MATTRLRKRRYSCAYAGTAEDYDYDAVALVCFVATSFLADRAIADAPALVRGDYRRVPLGCLVVVTGAFILHGVDAAPKRKAAKAVAGAVGPALAAVAKKVCGVFGFSWPRRGALADEGGDDDSGADETLAGDGDAETGSGDGQPLMVDSKFLACTQGLSPGEKEMIRLEAEQERLFAHFVKSKMDFKSFYQKAGAEGLSDNRKKVLVKKTRKRIEGLVDQLHCALEALRGRAKDQTIPEPPALSVPDEAVFAARAREMREFAAELFSFLPVPAGLRVGDFVTVVYDKYVLWRGDVKEVLGNTCVVLFLDGTEAKMPFSAVRKLAPGSWPRRNHKHMFSSRRVLRASRRRRGAARPSGRRHVAAARRGDAAAPLVRPTSGRRRWVARRPCRARVAPPRLGARAERAEPRGLQVRRCLGLERPELRAGSRPGHARGGRGPRHGTRDEQAAAEANPRGARGGTRPVGARSARKRSFRVLSESGSSAARTAESHPFDEDPRVASPPRGEAPPRL